jgi:hypothetical protein
MFLRNIGWLSTDYRLYIPGDITLDNHSCENLRSCRWKECTRATQGCKRVWGQAEAGISDSDKYIQRPFVIETTSFHESCRKEYGHGRATCCGWINIKYSKQQSLCLNVGQQECLILYLTAMNTKRCINNYCYVDRCLCFFCAYKHRQDIGCDKWKTYFTMSRWYSTGVVKLWNPLILTIHQSLF